MSRGKSQSEIKRRRELVEMAQRLADNAANDGLRVVCVVTDASGDFVGVGMNTAGDDADRILRCAVAGEDLLYADALDDGAGYTRKGRTTSTLDVRKRTSDTSTASQEPK